MRSRTQSVGRWLVLVLVTVVAVSSLGCGYLKNLRDDALDVGTLAVGVVPPVVPTEEGTKGVGFFPPAIGAYAQVTDLFHLGALYKITGDAEWDRRGYGLTIDERRKIGLGPIHDVYIKQWPYLVNSYKLPESEMSGWRSHMDELKDPLFGSSAKTLIYEPEKWDIYGSLYQNTWQSLPWLANGWQDWEMISLEVAIPEPFILHTGFYFRAGIDPSQVFDLVLGVFTLDLYDDAAYNLDGSLKY